MKFTAMTSALVLGAMACGQGYGIQTATPSAPAADTAPAQTACLADEIPVAAAETGPREPCELAAGECHARCDAGHPAACLEIAYSLEGGGQDEQRLANSYFARACRAGVLNGCTNFAARQRTGKGGIARDAACTTRVFERACSGREPWACGMFGGVLLEGEGIARDVGRARSVLESSCTRDKAFACAVLAEALRSGVWGSRDVARAEALDRIACKAGVKMACGDGPEAAPPAPVQAL